MTLAHLDAAAREAATPISMVQRPPQRRRDRPCLGPDLHHPSVLVVPHHDTARVAGQPSRRSRGNVRPVFEGRFPQPGPHPPGPQRPRGPRPDTGPRGILDRARDEEPPRPVGPGRPPAAAAGSERPWRDRWPAGCSRWPGAADTASHELPRARAGAARRLPRPSACGARRCRPYPRRCAGSGPHADAQPREPRAAGLPGASPARCAPRGPLCPRAPPRAIGLGIRSRDTCQGANLGVGELPPLQSRGHGRQRLEARATRTRSRAEPGTSPIRHVSHSAHRKPVFQPPRVSNSRMSARRRAVAASRWAESSAIWSPRRFSSAVRCAVGCNVVDISDGRACMRVPFLLRKLSTSDSARPGSVRMTRTPRTPRSAVPGFTNTRLDQDPGRSDVHFHASITRRGSTCGTLSRGKRA